MPIPDTHETQPFVCRYCGRTRSVNDGLAMQCPVHGYPCEPVTPEMQETRQEPSSEPEHVHVYGSDLADPTCIECIGPRSVTRSVQECAVFIKNEQAGMLNISSPREPQKDETCPACHGNGVLGQWRCPCKTPIRKPMEPREPHAALIAELEAAIERHESDAARCDKNRTGWWARSDREAAAMVSSLTVEARGHRETASLLYRCLLALKGA